MLLILAFLLPSDASYRTGELKNTWEGKYRGILAVWGEWVTQAASANSMWLRQKIGTQNSRWAQELRNSQKGIFNPKSYFLGVALWQYIKYKYFEYEFAGHPPTHTHKAHIRLCTLHAWFSSVSICLAQCVDLHYPGLLDFKGKLVCLKYKNICR